MIFREMMRDRAGLFIMIGYAAVALGLAAYVVYSERAARPGGVLIEQGIIDQEITR